MVPPIIDNAPWWANAILILLVALITSSVTVLVTHMTTRRKLAAVGDDVSQVKEQVQNSHASNLREDVDGVRDLVKSVVREQESHGRFLADLDRTIRAVTHSMDRRTDLQEKALAQAVEDRRREVAEQIEQAITGHVTDCPLRKEDP